MACVHGDTRTYATCHVVVCTTREVFKARAGIVPNLLVPVLIGWDCPIFLRLWDPEREDRARGELPQRTGRGGRPAFGATRRSPSGGTTTAEDPDPGEEGPSTPGSPVQSTRDPDRTDPGNGAPTVSSTATASEQGDAPGESESSPLTELSDFARARGEDSARPGQFATAQLQDDTLRHAWGHVVSHDGQVRDSVGPLTHPHFCTRGGATV